jgi:hypothetical protein
MFPLGYQWDRSFFITSIVTFGYLECVLSWFPGLGPGTHHSASARVGRRKRSARTLNWSSVCQDVKLNTVWQDVTKLPLPVS